MMMGVDTFVKDSLEWIDLIMSILVSDVCFCECWIVSVLVRRKHERYVSPFLLFTSRSLRSQHPQLFAFFYYQKKMKKRCKFEGNNTYIASCLPYGYLGTVQQTLWPETCTIVVRHTTVVWITRLIVHMNVTMWWKGGSYCWESGEM